VKAQEDWRLSPRKSAQTLMPDITYGLSGIQFTTEQMMINCLYYEQTGICPADLWHAFCIIEAKMKGTIEAVYQSFRGGAALINAARQLKYLSGADISAEGVTSLAVNPTVIALQVHWTEVINGETLFYIHHIYTEAPEFRGQGVQLRHNILDWGTLDRKEQVIKMLTEISTALANHTVRQQKCGNTKRFMSG